LLADYGTVLDPGAAPSLGVELLLRIVPRNPLKAAADGEMLPVIFFSLMLGLALASLPAARQAPLRQVLESLADACVAMIGLVMRLGPVGVFCLIFTVTARFGDGLLVALAGYVATVLGGLLVFQVVGYGLVLKLAAGRSPLDFFRRTQLVMLTAFSTSSSNATLPTTLRVAAGELGLSREVSGFVLPLGATLNMNGTALFEGATVLFLAQVFGVTLDLPQQLVVVVLSVLTAVGTAGIPGGSIPLLVTVLSAVQVPAEGIAIVLGVDRLLDMARTVLNVTGDLVTACVVARRVTPAEVASAAAAAGTAQQAGVGA
jgi:DAACS family dicarboxylate/amino acid:cation (Na+ or H+) symporter